MNYIITGAFGAFEKQLDTLEEAETHMKYLSRYKRPWKITEMTDKEFHKYLTGHDEIITDPEKSRAYGMLQRK